MPGSAPTRKSPVRRKAWEDARERAEDLHAIWGKTALLVGPEDKSTRVMRWKMEGLRCGVLRARAGTQAVALFRERAPDLVLVDPLLPDMSAADFYNSLAESRKPIVFLGVSRHQWDELHKLGRNVVCVGRPFDPEEAAAASGDIIRREQTDAGASI